MSTKRQIRLAAKKSLELPQGKLEIIDLSLSKNVPTGCTSAYRNNKYTVTVYENVATTHGAATKAMVQKHGDTPLINHWSEMQRIKNEIFGCETVAVEYYPKDSELIDHHNIYWMWVFPIGVLPVPVFNHPNNKTR